MTVEKFLGMSLRAEMDRRQAVHGSAAISCSCGRHTSSCAPHMEQTRTPDQSRGQGSAAHGIEIATSRPRSAAVTRDDVLWGLSTSPFTGDDNKRSGARLVAHNRQLAGRVHEARGKRDEQPDICSVILTRSRFNSKIIAGSMRTRPTRLLSGPQGSRPTSSGA